MRGRGLCRSPDTTQSTYSGCTANWYGHGWPGGQGKADDRLITGETEGASVLTIIGLQRIHVRS